MRKESIHEYCQGHGKGSWKKNIWSETQLADNGVENVQTDYRNVYGTHKMMTRLILSRHCPMSMERG